MARKKWVPRKKSSKIGSRPGFLVPPPAPGRAPNGTLRTPWRTLWETLADPGIQARAGLEPGILRFHAQTALLVKIRAERRFDEKSVQNRKITQKVPADGPPTSPKRDPGRAPNGTLRTPWRTPWRTLWETLADPGIRARAALRRARGRPSDEPQTAP